MADSVKDPEEQLRPEVVVEGELWSARAQDWADVQEKFLDPCYFRVLDRTGIGEGDRVLDVGCGSGRFLRLAAGRGAKVTGLDAASGMLDIARSRTPGGVFHLGDMESLPFVDESFHLVTGFNSFSHAADPVRALREASRVARPEGRIALTVWGPPKPGSMRAIVSQIIRSVLSDEDEHRAGGAAREPGQEDQVQLAKREGRAPHPEDDADEAHGHSITPEDDLEGLLREAGLTPLELGEIDCTFFYPDQTTLLKGLMSPGPFVEAARRAGESRVRAAILESMEHFKTQTSAFSCSNSFRYLIASPSTA